MQERLLKTLFVTPQLKFCGVKPWSDPAGRSLADKATVKGYRGNQPRSRKR
jgi:hypothetical protein